jgi:hypothetical protein
MSRPFTIDKFVGDTATCFADLINKYPGLTVHELIVEFCKVPLETVHRWQRREYFPGGEQLLRLRCFLQLAGYDVTEFKALNGDAQRLAFDICFGPFELDEVEKKLGYNPNGHQAVWGIVLRGAGYSDVVETNMRNLLGRRRKATAREREEDWRARITTALESLGAPKVVAQEPLERSSIDPGLPVSFARLVGATTALGGVLVGDPQVQRAVLDATRTGLDLEELVGILQKFLPQDD